MSIEDLDLAEVATRIQARVPADEPPVGYLRGRSFFRDLLVAELGVSELEAEELVDTLEMNGYLRFTGDPAARSQADARWEILRPLG